jgi:hypothetical protein
MTNIVMKHLPNDSDADVIKGELWRACLEGGRHRGGVGATALEAMGCLLFNFPEITGPFSFIWETPIPENLKG